MKIKIVNRTIFAFHKYDVFSLQRDLLINVRDIPMTYKLITLDNYNQFESEGRVLFENNYKVKFIKEMPSLVKAVAFFTNGAFVGYAFLHMKGSHDQIVSIDACESYLSQIEVFEQYRGNGYAGKMISILFDAFDLNEMKLCCNPENNSAQRLYEKIGFSREGRIRYIRCCGKNIPSHTL